MIHAREKHYITKDNTMFYIKILKGVEKLTHFIVTIFNCHLTYKILSLLM